MARHVAPHDTAHKNTDAHHLTALSCTTLHCTALHNSGLCGPYWGPQDGMGYAAILISLHAGDPEKAGVMQPISFLRTLVAPRWQGL